MISIGIAIGCALCLRFSIKPAISRLGASTAVAVAIIWYLVMTVGELIIFNFTVTWSTPLQKIGVNIFWLAFDGPYCIYLGAKLMQGKLKLKQCIPAYFFYSTIVCV